MTEFLRHTKTSTIVVVLFFLAFFPRLYRINNPALDWHAWRQADTASVSQEFVDNGIDVLHPRYHDVSSIPSGLDNPQGYRMVEFPIINALVAMIVRQIPDLGVELVSRLLAAAASSGTAVFLYLLVTQLGSKKEAIASGIAYAVLPFSIFYGRVILPEPFVQLFFVMSLFFFARWLRQTKISDYVWSIVALALATLLKPFVLFFALTWIVLIWIFKGAQGFKQPLVWLYPIISVLPFVSWRWWISQFPEGIPASDWLFNSNGIRWRPSWVRWLFFERIGRLILGGAGVVLASFSVLSQKRRLTLTLGSLWVGVVLYLSVLATGNVQHDYYQSLLLPTIALTLGMGGVSLYRIAAERRLNGKFEKFSAVFILGTISAFMLFGMTFLIGLQASAFYPERILTDISSVGLWTAILGATVLISRKFDFSKDVQSRTALLLVSAICISTWLGSWQYVHGYFNINHWEYQRYGKLVDDVLPQDTLIIVPTYGGDTQFLYQTHRQGWPIGGDIEQKIAQGAEYYVSVNSDEERAELSQRYQVQYQQDGMVILDLTSPLPEALE